MIDLGFKNRSKPPGSVGQERQNQVKLLHLGLFNLMSIKANSSHCPIRGNAIIWFWDKCVNHSKPLPLLFCPIRWNLLIWSCSIWYETNVNCSKPRPLLFCPIRTQSYYRCARIALVAPQRKWKEIAAPMWSTDRWDSRCFCVWP